MYTAPSHLDYKEFFSDDTSSIAVSGEMTSLLNIISYWAICEAISSSASPTMLSIPLYGRGVRREGREVRGIEREE